MSRDGRSYFKPAMAGIFLAAICLVGAPATLARRGGTAAKGGIIVVYFDEALVVRERLAAYLILAVVRRATVS